MLRRLGIRAKVLAVLAVPMLVVLLAAAFISSESLRDLRSERAAQQVIDLVAAYAPLHDALNDERIASQTGATPEDVAAARERTDAAAADFESAADSADLSGFSAGLAPRLAEVERQLSDDLTSTRADVDNGVQRVVGTAYSSIISGQVDFFDTVGQELPNRPLAAHVTAYVAVARTADSLVGEYIEGATMLAAPATTPAAGQAYSALANQTEVFRRTARNAVDLLALPGVQLPSSDPTLGFSQMRYFLGTGQTTALAALTPEAHRGAIQGQLDTFAAVSTGLTEAAGTLAAHAVTNAQQRAVLVVGVTALAAAASLVLALLVSRAIVIPLRRLTAAATDVREDLPRLVEQVQAPGERPQLSVPQIPVTTRDEVGRLAAAFNSVNATTIHVAQEQAALRGSIAEMFVNVARRDQVLLNRQLSFIDSLERTEEDPQALANLFRLDHLATRMRRNAESLLVLAGIDSGRRLRDALPLSDVVRTASSEIEQYDRVELDLQVDPHMLGFNALPSAHLLAELLENATVFSEPETPVIVTTGVAGPYVEVRIVDHGLGMSDSELDAANHKIVSTAASDALGAQRLGLFVVGRLAQRLGAEVELRKSSLGSNGTETVVRFPATLFQSTEASPLGFYGTAGALTAQDAPLVQEVDLDALTAGITEQGLPRRRTGGDDSIVLPEVTATALSDDLGSTDWAPIVAAGTNPGLPSRSPSAAAVAAEEAARAAAPADPVVRSSLFAGFRGRSDLTAAGAVPGSEAGPDEAMAYPAFVVPGLAPDDEATASPAAEATWAEDEPAAGQGVPSWQAWVSEQPATPWPEPVADYVPATLPEPSVVPALAPLDAWTPPAAVAAAPVAEEPAVERWTPPEVDVAQWPALDEPAPAFAPAPAGFDALPAWPAPQAAADEEAPYAPFERTLDEARAWATGAIPTVPEPAGFPAADEWAPVAAAAEPVVEPEVVAEPFAVVDEAPVEAPDMTAADAHEQNAWAQWDSSDAFTVPQLEPEPWALEPMAVAAEPATEPVAAGPEFEEVPAALVEPFVADEPVPVTPGWAPIGASAAGAFTVPPVAEPKRRRGLFGRRKRVVVAPAPIAQAAPVPPLPPAPAPVLPPAPADAPVRTSAWGPVSEPAPVVEETPPPAAPVGNGAWAPQSSWSPPPTASLTEATGARPTPSWSPPDWAPRPAPVEAGAEAEQGAATADAEPGAAPRIGTLDDEVAAMLALRSDIQEQALSELSQLSAYRPQVVTGTDRLQRRVPTAVPEAPSIVESADGAERDPDELRSRLASFQSGTARGRRESGQDGETE